MNKFFSVALKLTSLAWLALGVIALLMGFASEDYTVALENGTEGLHGLSLFAGFGLIFIVPACLLWRAGS